MRSRLLIPISLLLLAGLAYGGVRFLRRPPAVPVGEVRRETVVRVLALTGRLRPHFLTDLKPRVSATVLTMTKQDGDAVAAGEVLARLDDRPQRAQVEQARSTASAEQKNLAQAERDLARAQELFQAGLLPAADLEGKRLAVEGGRDALRQREQAVREAAAHLDDYLLRAPHDGFVLTRPVDPGQMVGPDTTVYRLGTAADPWVEALVDEVYLGEVREGLAAEIAVPGGRGGPDSPGGAGGKWPAHVVFVGRQVDRQSGSATIRLAFDGPAPQLPSGLSLDLNIRVAKHENALTVPRSALLLGNGQTAALVAPKGSRGAVEKRAVDVIDWPAERVVVRSGLALGERVVLAPRGIAAGAEIRPLLETPAGK